MATSGQGIWAPFGSGGSVRDYTHAAQIFRTNDFARAPKSKYLFYVSFILNPNASANGISSPQPIGDNELSYLVKTVDLPRFDIDVADLNQYNKKVIIQRSIKYNPITIKFHDDNTGSLRAFWANYYGYYYNDGRAGVDYSIDDKYNVRRQSRWGFDTNSTAPYLSAIEIYSMYHSEAQLITLQNPVISQFTHDSHDYSEGTGSLEATMQIHYTGVTYEDGIDAQNEIPGFGQAAPETYDTEFSDLQGLNFGLQVNRQSGQLFDPLASVVSNVISSVVNPKLNQQTYAYNNYNPTAPNYVTNQQVSSVLRNAATSPINAGYRFPTANIQNVVFEDWGAVAGGNGLASSDGNLVNSPGQNNSLYDPGSWQQSLYSKGYQPNQIADAFQYIQSQGTGGFGAGTNYQQIAELYLNNSSQLDEQNVPTYGHPSTQPTEIDFANPVASVQPVYNSQDWQSQLISQGYNSSDIATANRFLNGLKVAPGADLTSIAANYINYSKQNGSTTPVFSEAGFVNTDTQVISGPNFNPVTGVSDAGINAAL
jgi:hypothetical protein